MIKALLRFLHPLRGIDKSLQRLVTLYEAELRERNIVIPNPKAEPDMTEITYDSRVLEMDEDA